MTAPSSVILQPNLICLGVFFLTIGYMISRTQDFKQIKKFFFDIFVLLVTFEIL